VGGRSRGPGVTREEVACDFRRAGVRRGPLLYGIATQHPQQGPASYSGRDYGGYPAAKLRMSAGDG